MRARALGYVRSMTQSHEEPDLDDVMTPTETVHPDHLNEILRQVAEAATKTVACPTCCSMSRR